MTPNRRRFLGQLSLGAAGAGLVSFTPRAFAAPDPGQLPLPRSTPEAAGVASGGVLAFLDGIARGKHELHSFMLARHGRVVSEGWWAPYAPAFNHTMYSMSKSFTSTAVGLAVAEGRLTVEDRVVKFFPKELPDKVSDHLAAMRVRDLLSMATGNEKEPTQAVVKSENWVRTFLAQPIAHAPGSVFMYNSAATYMCSAIVQQVTGQRMLDYLRPRLFDPLGLIWVTWEQCPLGRDTGGWGLSVPTEALAKFGQLYLQKGKWNGRQLLSEKWVAEATSFKIQQPPRGNAKSRPKEQDDWQQGYGYQFWRCRHNAFRGDGAFGQFTIVLPEQDAVIAMTAETSNMQGVLDLVWEHLLPAFEAKPLPADKERQEKLKQTLASLALAMPEGKATSPTAERVARKTVRFDANELGLESAHFTLNPGTWAVEFRGGPKRHIVAGSWGRWNSRGETTLPGTPPRLISGGAPKPGTAHKYSGCAAWTGENTLELMLRYYETPHHDSLTFKFNGDQVQLSFLSSLAKMRGAKDSRPLLQGRVG
ncbi:MAG: beta-lactamase [Limisphaerales bacterium]|nr:MAG: beta-lactamase [Limisphaerales bacterium]TXT45889.1 MAG: beta-lactamase [Limisphaerales bacterium]